MHFSNARIQRTVFHFLGSATPKGGAPMDTQTVIALCAFLSVVISIINLVDKK